MTAKNTEIVKWGLYLAGLIFTTGAIVTTVRFNSKAIDLNTAEIGEHRKRIETLEGSIQRFDARQSIMADDVRFIKIRLLGGRGGIGDDNR